MEDLVVRDPAVAVALFCAERHILCGFFEYLSTCVINIFSSTLEHVCIAQDE